MLLLRKLLSDAGWDVRRLVHPDYRLYALESPWGSVEVHWVPKLRFDREPTSHLHDWTLLAREDEFGVPH